MAAEVGLAGFGAIVAEVVKALFKPIIRQISYVFKSQSYIDELKKQEKELGFKKERVEKATEEAIRQGDEIYGDVTDWFDSVDEFTQKVAKPIIEDEDGAKKSCFKGLCPNLLSRYKLSKRAAKAAKDAADHLEKGYFPKVSYRRSLETTVFRGVKDCMDFDSRKKVFQDVLDALKGDKLNITGVYGMGGVGKTTLVKQVAKQVMEDKLFDKVVMAEVTQTPDYLNIQDKLASDLDMKFELNESIHHRANRLCQRLKKEKRVLIILDNIWTKLELDKVGIPSGEVDKERKDDQSRCTIILTSRNRDLLERDMKSRKNFPIKVLSKEEALQLFENIEGNSAKTSDIQPIAVQIVERCGGLPIALTTIANALKGKSLHIWTDALNQLSKSDAREIHGMQANVYTSIELSYKLLESDEAKSLFLLCALFGEGNPIPVPDLLRYGKGMDYFENVYTLEEARSRVHRLIDNLKSSCLLLDGDAEDEVKMHDVIRVVAVSIAERERMFNIPNVANVKKKMEETRKKVPIAIFLPYRDIQVLPERLQCPHLKLFLLFTEGECSMQVSDHFFEGTEGLKVLDFTGIHFSSLPSSLGRLINLQTLCLDRCQLEDVAVVGQLNKLEILSLQASGIKQLPHEIGQLTQLQLLDLSNCWSLEVIAPNVISKLCQLEELYMGNSFSQWEKVEGGSKASLVELKGLSKLTTLEIHVREADILPQDLVSQVLQRYRICIGKKSQDSQFFKYEIPRFMVTSQTSRLMKLLGLEKVSVLLENYGMKLLLQRTEDLYLEELKGVQNVVHDLDDGEGFPQLKHLRVANCHEILHIVGSVEWVRCNTIFPLLESFFLYELIKLETICDSQLTEDQSFSNLRIIQVESCKKLKHLFSFSVAKNLLLLQKVELACCDKLKTIVGPDMEKLTTLGSKEIIAEDDTNQKVVFPSLEELTLRVLKSIEKLWSNQFQGMSYCQNLKKVTVWDCHRMKYLFSYSMVNGLSQLQHLYIEYCDSMEGVVVDTRGLGRNEGNLIELKVFPKLRFLHLSRLKNLTSFASMLNSVVEFPSLAILAIENCHNMLRFISTSSPEDNIHLEMQPLFDEKVRFPSLEELNISFMHKLRKIWHHQLASESFNKLKKLHIQICADVMNIFPPLVGIPRSLVNLRVSGCEKIKEIIGHGGEEVKETRIVFNELKHLELDYLPRLTSFCLENFTLEFPSLERVSITRCPSMETFSQGNLSTPKLDKVQVIHNRIVFIHREVNELCRWEGDLNSTIQKCCEEMVGFRYLNSLRLSHFPRLREIWQALPVSFFNNLRILVVDDCTNMSSAILANLLRCLKNLQLLEVRNCDSLEEVLHFEEPINANEEHFELPKLWSLTIDNCPNMETFVSNSTSALQMPADNKEPHQKIRSEENFLLTDHIQPLLDDKVALPNLIELKLSRLPKVLHLWKQNAESNEVFANLQGLEISECSKLQKLVPSSWHFIHLKSLEVSKCHELINLLTLSTSESLVNLRRMKMADCKMIEEIIQSQLGEEAKDYIVFRKLEYLGLDCLPSLTSFCSSNYALLFPSLEQVLVRQCPNMKIFSQGVVDTPNLNKVKLTEVEDDDEGCWEGNLNDTIQKLFNEMNSKDKIEPTFQVQ